MHLIHYKNSSKERVVFSSFQPNRGTKMSFKKLVIKWFWLRSKLGAQFL